MTIRKGQVRKEWEAKNRRREHQNDLVRQYKGALKRDAELLGDLGGDANALNAERQMGRTLTFQEIEALIKKLAPELRCLRTRVDKAGVFAPMGDGTYKEICPFEWPISPEWSISELKMEEVPIGDIPEVTTKLDQLMMEEIPTMGREVVRGWRTLFARLILSGWISLGRLERELPETQMRKSWVERLKGVIRVTGEGR